MAGKPNGHCLVIGGTGMLAWACLQLAGRGTTVSVLARNEGRLQGLQEQSEHINPIKCDYQDGGALKASLNAAQAQYGPIDQAIIWIHSTAPDASEIVADHIGAELYPVDYYHILGSAAGNPEKQADVERSRAIFQEKENINYRTIVLGFMIENGRSRWLNDDEISQGVYDAVKEQNDRTIIGTIEPWSARP